MAQRISQDRLAAALQAPSFGPNVDNTDNRPTPDVDMRLLKLDELKPYDRNPRQADNPAYARLKASIQSAGGLNTPLTVTRRPGERRYMVAAGGNSRLQVLQELAAETQDSAFTQVVCRHQPWTSESRVMVGHLIENDVRGNMTFIDKARAVMALRDLYSADLANGPLTQRDLKQRLDAAGFGLALSLLNTYLLAVEHLYPHLPQLLDSGLGVGPVRQLLRLWRKTTRYVELTTSPVDNSLAQAAFTACCRREDQPQETFLMNGFLATLAIELGAGLDRDAKLVALDLDGLLHGVAPPSRDRGTDSAAPDHWTYEATRQSRREKQVLQREASTPAEQPEISSSAIPVGARRDTTPLRIADDIPALQSEIRRLATHIAKREGFVDVIASCENSPGYRVAVAGQASKGSEPFAINLLRWLADEPRLAVTLAQSQPTRIARNLDSVLDGVLLHDDSVRAIAELILCVRWLRRMQSSTSIAREE